MTTRWPSGCVSAVCGISRSHYASSRLTVATPVLYRIPQTRQYAKGHSKRPPPPPQVKSQARQFRKDAEISPGTALPPPDAVKSAFDVVSAGAEHDPVNPPRSTLPPRLTLPVRGAESTVIYYFNLGRAYGRFYKDGIKAVWYNFKAAKALNERLDRDFKIHGKTASDLRYLVQNGLVSRADFQLMTRNRHDIGKLPLFGLLVLVFGEWLPLLVPFIPNAVPTTCRIPKQLRQMQEKQEERRRRAFMLGVAEPSAEQWPEEVAAKDSTESTWPVACDKGYVTDIVKKLKPNQLYHLSCVLGLHKHFWDKIQLPAPSVVTGRAIVKRLSYLAADDLLLLSLDKSAANQGKNRGWDKSSKPVNSLSPDELRIAVAERGFDVLGYSDDALRERLIWWLDRQVRDEGRGRAMLGMLFRRLDMREWVKLNLPANEGARPDSRDDTKAGRK